MSHSFFDQWPLFGQVGRRWITAIATAASLASNTLAQEMPRLRAPRSTAAPRIQRTSDFRNDVRLQGSIAEIGPEEEHVSLVQAAQGFDEPKKPLPQQIVAMPDVTEEMEVVQRRSQLIVTRANVTRTAISDPSVIDLVQFSPNEFALIGLALGSTTLTLWFEGNPEPLIYTVKTIRDPSLDERRRVDYGKLERKLQLLFPNSKVYLIPLSQKIIVKGQARDAEEAARILQIVRGEIINHEGSLFGPNSIAPAGADYAVGAGTGNGGLLNGYNNDFWSSYIVNMLDVPGEYQVMIKVRIAELSRAQLRRLGIDFEYLINDGRQAVNYALGGVPSTLSGIFENGEISVLMNWLHGNGTVKILSEPTLTVISGHSASFLSGGEFAVPTIVGINGVGGQQTTFRGFGTSIIVTPMVVDRDLIRMRIIPEYSEINAQNAVAGIPGLNSRRVQTTVELREGQTIVLAGLFGHRSDTEVNRIPLLGDIPRIGTTLFSSKRATQDEKELLVTVTPEIVRPMDSDEVPPYPGFYVTHPDDCQLYYHAMTEGPPDLEAYQLQPYGRGNGNGMPVGYRVFEPAPAQQNYTPQPTPAGGYPPASNYTGHGPQRPPTPATSPATPGRGAGQGAPIPLGPPPGTALPPTSRRPGPGPSAQYGRDGRQLGQMPSGQMPMGQMPRGQMPVGQMSSGPMPRGQMMPSGQMPPASNSIMQSGYSDDGYSAAESEAPSGAREQPAKKNWFRK